MKQSLCQALSGLMTAESAGGRAEKHLPSINPFPADYYSVGGVVFFAETFSSSSFALVFPF